MRYVLSTGSHSGCSSHFFLQLSVPSQEQNSLNSALFIIHFAGLISQGHLDCSAWIYSDFLANRDRATFGNRIAEEIRGDLRDPNAKHLRLLASSLPATDGAVGHTGSPPDGDGGNWGEESFEQEQAYREFKMAKSLFPLLASTTRLVILKREVLHIQKIREERHRR